MGVEVLVATVDGAEPLAGVRGLQAGQHQAKVALVEQRQDVHTYGGVSTKF